MAQRSVACVVPDVVSVQIEAVRAPGRVSATFAIVLRRNEPSPLSGEIPLRLSVAQTIRVEPDTETNSRFVGRVSAYFYVVAQADAREIVSFHWHPAGLGTATTPHLHIGPAATGSDPPFRPGSLHKAHISTGYVPLEAVIRMLITEFGVEPRRADWESVLTEP
jgi:hypothetical protein